MTAAEKIAATGLPTRAVDDRLLRAVMEDGALEDDDSMQTRWANLLANAAIRERARPRVAFPEILKQLSSIEAAMLDAMSTTSPGVEDPALAPSHLDACWPGRPRSRLQPFVKLARTIRRHRAGILAAIRLGLSNGRLERLSRSTRIP